MTDSTWLTFAAATLAGLCGAAAVSGDGPGPGPAALRAPATPGPRSGPGRRADRALAPAARRAARDAVGMPDASGGHPVAAAVLAGALAAVLAAVIPLPVHRLGPLWLVPALPLRPQVCAAGSVAGFRVVRRLPSRAGSARRQAERAAAPVVLELVAMALRAGAGPAQAARYVSGLPMVDGGLAARLAGVAQALEFGATPDRAWGLLTGSALSAFASCMPRATAHGSGVADELDGLARALRADLVAAAVSRARSAGVTAVVPLGVCFLPAFLLLAVVPVLVGAIAQLHV